MYDAIVIGGGIVGASVAYRLARNGAEPLVLDERAAGRATDAGAGILSGLTSKHTSAAWYALAVESVKHYPTLTEELAADQDGPTGYSACEVLKVALSLDELNAYDELWETVREHRDRVGYPAPGTLDELSGEEARELFPPLGAAEQALHSADDARVDGKVLNGALERAGRRHGVTVEEERAERILTEDGAVAGVATDEDRYEAPNVVVSGGAWSSQFEEQLDLRLPVEPERGQIAHLDLGETDTSSWPIISLFDRCYMVPWEDNRVAVGATYEGEARFDPRTTVAGVHQILGSALDVAPALDDARIEEIRVGLRPVSADDLPILGEAPAVDGAFLATGHGSTGLTLGPYSGKLVADMVLGEPVKTTVDLDAFRPDRFL